MPYSPTFFFSSGNLPIATRTRLRAAMGIFRFSAYPLFRLSTNAIKDTVSVLYWYEELSRRNSGNFWNSSSELFFVSFLFGGGGWGGPGGGAPKVQLCGTWFPVVVGKVPHPRRGAVVQETRKTVSKTAASRIWGAPQTQIHHHSEPAPHQPRTPMGSGGWCGYGYGWVLGNLGTHHWVRPYLAESTISRPICEVKQPQA